MKTIIIGGPRCGKSSWAAALRAKTGTPIFCSDHFSKVKDPMSFVTYLPEEVSWYQPGNWVVSNWFLRPGDWIIEGSTLARALRYWIDEGFEGAPCNEIILKFIPMVADMSPGQLSLLKGVKTIWDQVSPYYHALDHISIHS